MTPEGWGLQLGWLVTRLSSRLEELSQNGHRLEDVTARCTCAQLLHMVRSKSSAIGIDPRLFAAHREAERLVGVPQEPGLLSRCIGFGFGDDMLEELSTSSSLPPIDRKVRVSLAIGCSLCLINERASIYDCVTRGDAEAFDHEDLEALRDALKLLVRDQWDFIAARLVDLSDESLKAWLRRCPIQDYLPEKPTEERPFLSDVFGSWLIESGSPINPSTLWSDQENQKGGAGPPTSQDDADLSIGCRRHLNVFYNFGDKQHWEDNLSRALLAAFNLSGLDVQNQFIHCLLSLCQDLSLAPRVATETGDVSWRVLIQEPEALQEARDCEHVVLVGVSQSGVARSAVIDDEIAPTRRGVADCMESGKATKLKAIVAEYMEALETRKLTEKMLGRWMTRVNRLLAGSCPDPISHKNWGDFIEEVVCWGKELRPDGAILRSDRRLAVVFEFKSLGALSSRQLSAYAIRLGPKAQILTLPWIALVRACLKADTVLFREFADYARGSPVFPDHVDLLIQSYDVLCLLLFLKSAGLIRFERPRVFSDGPVGLVYRTTDCTWHDLERLMLLPLTWSGSHCLVDGAKEDLVVLRLRFDLFGRDLLRKTKVVESEMESFAGERPIKVDHNLESGFKRRAFVLYALRLPDCGDFSAIASVSRRTTVTGSYIECIV